MSSLATLDAEELRPRQLSFDFDYGSYGISEAAAERLDTLAVEVQEFGSATRESQVAAYMAIAERVTAAQKEFRKQKKSESWTAYCRSKLGMDRSEAERAIAVHRTLGKRTITDLAGIPVAGLYDLCRESTTKEARAEVLKLAKTSYLTAKQVSKAVTPVLEGKPKTKPSVPADHAELKEYARKKLVNPLQNKVGGELFADIPRVLREVASEIEEELKAAAE